MNKESRLSFRISDDLNDAIERMVIVKQDVRDRSDLGNQAMEFYLQLLEGKTLDEMAYMEAIMQIAKEAEAESLEEIKILKELIDWFNAIHQEPLNEDLIE